MEKGRKKLLTPPEEYERFYVLRKINGIIYTDNVDSQTLEGTETLQIHIEDLFEYFGVTKVKVMGIGEYKEYEKTY